jgi:hypothetical protein
MAAVPVPCTNNLRPSQSFQSLLHHHDYIIPTFLPACVLRNATSSTDVFARIPRDSDCGLVGYKTVVLQVDTNVSE